MYCSNCGKYISIIGRSLSDSKGNKYCSVKCHWEGTHKAKEVSHVYQTHPNRR